MYEYAKKTLKSAAAPQMNDAKVDRRMEERQRTSVMMVWRHSARNPTTSFLTATTLIYAIGAGITAAAGFAGVTGTESVGSGSTNTHGGISSAKDALKRHKSRLFEYI